MASRDTVFLDLETTSLRRPWMDAPRQVWDVGYVVWLEGNPKIRREVQFFVEVETRDADPFALKINKFYQRYPHYAEPYRNPLPASPHDILLERSTAAMVLANDFRDSIIVGNNPRFDEESLAVLCHEEGHLFDPYYHLIDVYAVSIGVIMGANFFNPEEMPYESRNLSQMVGVDPPSKEDEHSALADALWAERWYSKLAGADTDA